MKIRRILTLSLAAVMLFSALTACSNGATEKSSAGQASETTGATSGESADAASGENTKATSGEITVYTALEDEQVTALLAEKDNPQADVVWGTAASSMMVLDDQGGLKAYAPEGVDRILPQFKSDKEVPTWVGIDAWETAIVVNTDEAEKLNLPEIKSYQDLLDPAFKGHIVMSNPNSSGTGFLTVSAILQLMGEEEGWAYLDALHENVSQYVHSGSKPAKMAAAGECAVGISFGYAGLSQKDKGAPVEVIFPEEGSGWDLEANALINKDEINPAAYTFLDWAISDSAMALYKENYPIITTSDVGSYEGYDSNPLDQLIDNDFSWAASNRESILNTWMEKYDGKSAPEE